MQPEISRRCLSCGASVRAEALFCPECGQSMSPPAQSTPIDSEAAAGTNNSDAGPQTAAPLIEGESFAAVAEQKGQSGRVKVAPLSKTSLSKKRRTQPRLGTKTSAPASPEPERAGGKAREQLQRASTAARGAIEGNVKRVERIRQVSTVVLEEAHYDASLRFVLVAVVLFVIVTVLLVLSKVMG